MAKKIEKILAFLKILCHKLLVQFLTFYKWNVLGGTKNDVDRRRFLISSIYCDKK